MKKTKHVNKTNFPQYFQVNLKIMSESFLLTGYDVL